VATIPEALAIARQYHQSGQLQAAEQLYRQILEVEPNHPEALRLLGVAACQVGNYRQAIDCIGRAISLSPYVAAYHLDLGNALMEERRLDEAVAAFRRALELKPDYAYAHNNLGNARKGQRQIAEAIACYRRALQVKPDFVEAHSNLGLALHEQGLLDEAIASYHRALQLKPDLVEAHNNLGLTLQEQGELPEAIACYRRVLDLRPGDSGTHSNLLYALNFCPGYDPQTIRGELRRWSEQFAEPLAKHLQPHFNDRSPHRRLRVGYVSPDFRSHPVGRFLLPLLESHDHESFQIFCYASVLVPDRITESCRAHADMWRSVLGFSDQQVAEVIRRDQIDILVDLTMHMANNRLLVFARKPAPVQVTYLAYCGTTGLSTIDYRLTDPYLDPPGRFDPFYSEQSIHLPETYWCYQPLVQVPCVPRVPALKAGRVTFGCLNNFCKATAATLAAWSELLQAVPQSRLLLHAQVGRHRDRVSGFFAQQDISADRVMFVKQVPVAEYFEIYERIDVALDPFPYGGGTTTCDALWMGVPVVSLAGQTAVGRGGVSILSNVGLPELVAQDSEQYVRIAVELAQDLCRLSELRATLRDRMQASPLMNAPRFARNVEAAYRNMWQRWCAK
jgi:predicted O-linked N-acetylglucosamine transferase (SPINDLY family)